MSDDSMSEAEAPGFAGSEAGTLWDDDCQAVPWSGNTYFIVEKASRDAITISSNGKLVLQPRDDHRQLYDEWLCVEIYGLFGFHNPKTGRYLGRDDHHRIIASATKAQAWECITPRQHPDGGYQLLVLQDWFSAELITVAEDGFSLVTRQHGTTLWEFIKVK